MKRALKIYGVVILAASAAACLDDVSGTRPLTLEVDADVSTTVVGQEVTFSYDVTGTRIARVTLDYGDGDTDTRDYTGPVEISDFAVHAYAAAGTYEVVGVAIDTQGSVADTIEIVVN